MKTIIIVVALVMGTWFANPANDLSINDDIEVQNKETSFAEFLSKFPLQDDPIDIGFAEIEQFNDDLNKKGFFSGKKALDYSALSKYLPHEAIKLFSRRSGNREVFPLARVYVDTDRLAVAYVSVDGKGPVFYKKSKFSSKNSSTNGKLKRLINQSYRGLSFNIQLYDLDGNMITSSGKKIVDNNSISEYQNNKIEIAGRSIDNTHIGYMDQSGNVTKTTYKNQWAKDVYTYGIEGNSIIRYVKLEHEKKSLLVGNDNITGSMVNSTSNP